MMRKMAYAGMSFLAGLFFSSFFSAKINVIIFSFVSIISLIIILVNKKPCKGFMLAAAFFCLSLLSNVAYTKFIYENIICYDNDYISFEGKIKDYELIDSDKYYVTLKGRINNSVNAKVTAFINTDIFTYNDEIKLIAKAEKIEDSFLFPSESYYKSENIFITLSDIKEMTITKDSGFSFYRWIMRYRDNVCNTITQTLDGDEGGFLCAMITGKKDYMSDTLQATLNRAGIGHIVAVSGTHLMIVTGVLYFVLSLLCVGKYFKFIINEVVIIVFVIFSGMSISVIRSAIMLTIVLLAGVTKRRADTLNSLGIAVILITFFSPYSIRSASLILSFMGVFSVGVIAPYVLKLFRNKSRLNNILCTIITACIISIFTGFVGVFYFDEISLVAPLVNIFVIPLCSFALICGIILIAFGTLTVVANPFLLLSGITLKSVIGICTAFSKIPFAYFPLGQAYLKTVVALCLLVIALMYYIFKKPEALAFSIVGSLLCIGITIIIDSTINDYNYVITILQYDSSCAVVIEEKNSVIVIDIDGDKKSAQSVQKYTKKNGISKVDALILKNYPQSAYSNYINTLTSQIDSVYINSLDGKIFTYREIFYYDNVDNYDVNPFAISFLDETIYVHSDKFSFVVSDGNEVMSDFKIKKCNDEYFLYVKNKKIITNSKDNYAIQICIKNDNNYIIRRLDDALCQ